MSVSTRLKMQQTQALTMTPRLRQAIELLALAGHELEEYVEAEILSNPVLEKDYREELGLPGSMGNKSLRIGHNLESIPENNTTDADCDPNLQINQNNSIPNNSLNRTNALKTNLDCDRFYDGSATVNGKIPKVLNVKVISEQNQDWGVKGRIRTENELKAHSIIELAAEKVPRDEATLQKHLSRQINIRFTETVTRLLGEYLIGYLDAAGYFTEETSVIAYRLGYDVTLVDNVLAQMQGLDPTGIFARDLSECLTLQLQEKGLFDRPMKTLVENLELLGSGNISEICTICKVKPNRVKKMIVELKKLNPKPGLAYDCEVATMVTPDIFISPTKDGGWIIELNNDNLPKLIVNNEYLSQIGSVALGKEEKTYISERIQSANWLIKALDQRARTILSVATEVMRKQKGFLDYGATEIQPLKLRNLADAIGVHESTVSRVISNKFISTPRGIFGLKYFFSSAIASLGGGKNYSSVAVQERLRWLIENEASNNTLSDAKLAEILRCSDVDIARRTVAKYRVAIGFPSSIKRHRLRRMETFMAS